MKPYLQTINASHVLSAALFLQANPVEDIQNPRKWAVAIEGQVYPTKALIQHAYCIANGINIDNIPVVFLTDQFTTQRAIGVLTKLGFVPYRI